MTALISKLNITTLAWPNYSLDVLNITMHTEVEKISECLCVVLEQSLWFT